MRADYSLLFLSLPCPHRLFSFYLVTYSRGTTQEFTNKVITLWYRPPEILLGATRYGAPVDMWSAGCILAELLLGRPLFTGKTEMEQLLLIFDLLGTPTASSWEGFSDLKLIRTGEVTIEKHRPSKLREKYGQKMPVAALNLVEKLLELDPKKRLTASRALTSRYFLTEPRAPERPQDLGILQLGHGGGHFHEFQTKKKRREAKAVAKKASNDARARGLTDKEAETEYDAVYRECMKKVADEGNAALITLEDKKEKKEERGKSKDEGDSQEKSVEEPPGYGFERQDRFDRIEYSERKVARRDRFEQQKDERKERSERKRHRDLGEKESRRSDRKDDWKREQRDVDQDREENGKDDTIHDADKEEASAGKRDSSFIPVAKSPAEERPSSHEREEAGGSEERPSSQEIRETSRKSPDAETSRERKRSRRDDTHRDRRFSRGKSRESRSSRPRERDRHDKKTSRRDSFDSHRSRDKDRHRKSSRDQRKYSPEAGHWEDMDRGGDDRYGPPRDMDWVRNSNVPPVDVRMGRDDRNAPPFGRPREGWDGPQREGRSDRSRRHKWGPPEGGSWRGGRSPPRDGRADDRNAPPMGRSPPRDGRGGDRNDPPIGWSPPLDGRGGDRNAPPPRWSPGRDGGQRGGGGPTRRGDSRRPPQSQYGPPEPYGPSRDYRGGDRAREPDRRSPRRDADRNRTRY